LREEFVMKFTSEYNADHRAYELYEDGRPTGEFYGDLLDAEAAVDALNQLEHLFFGLE